MISFMISVMPPKIDWARLSVQPRHIKELADR